MTKSAEEIGCYDDALWRIAPTGLEHGLVESTDPVEAYETMTHIAHTADEVGFRSVWLIDHFQTIPRPSQEVAFEAWTTTADFLPRLRKLVSSITRIAWGSPNCSRT